MGLPPADLSEPRPAPERLLVAGVVPLTQPLDPVEEDLALLVAQKLMPVTVLGFAQDGVPRLDTDIPAGYPVSGHRGASLWSGPSEGGGPRGGHFFILRIYCLICKVQKRPEPLHTRDPGPLFCALGA